MSKIDLSKALVFPSAITGGFSVGDRLVILNGSLVAIIPRSAVNTARDPEPVDAAFFNASGGGGSHQSPPGGGGVPVIVEERQDSAGSGYAPSLAHDFIVKAQRQDTHPAPVVEASVDPRWPGGPPLVPHVSFPTKDAILGVLRSKGPTRAYYIGNELGIPVWAHDIRADLSRKIKLLLSDGSIRKVKDSGRLAKYEIAE